MRLDKYILEKFSLRSRTYAENLIKTNQVAVNGEICLKPSFDVGDGDEVSIHDDNYASQGAYKLEKAFFEFHLDVKDKICLDLGCSNGGFTECLVRFGAKKVVAVDVGECVLPKSLTSLNFVEFVRANARDLPMADNTFDFVSGDLSFISLKYVLGEVYRVLRAGGECVVLIKPQFELDKSALNKSGIVKTEKLRLSALNAVKNYALSLNFTVLGECVSPVRYEDKNVEYLLHLKK